VIEKAIITKAQQGDEVQIKASFYGEVTRHIKSKRETKGALLHISGAVVARDEAHEAEVVETLRKGCECLGIPCEVQE